MLLFFPTVLIIQMFLLTTWDQQCDLNYSNHLEDLEHILKGNTAVFVMWLH